MPVIRDLGEENMKGVSRMTQQEASGTIFIPGRKPQVLSV